MQSPEHAKTLLGYARYVTPEDRVCYLDDALKRGAKAHSKGPSKVAFRGA